jgi:transglutaminase-like putative cysteine protease
MGGMRNLRSFNAASLKKTLAVCIMTALCSAAVWLIRSGVFNDVQTAAKSEPAYEIARQIRYSFTIQNTTSQLIENAVFRTWAPAKQTATQLCKRIDASDPFHVLSDDLGNQMLEFELHDFPPYGSRIISITTDLLMSPTPNRINPGDLQLWLGPEKYIESDHPDLKQRARVLMAGTPKETAANIFKWVNGHVQYCGYLKKDRGALYAFLHKRGDCTEYMYLFTALCRAGSIPARGIGGYIALQNSILKPAGFHNWAEYYDNERWHPADPQNNAFMKDGQNFIVMRIISASPDQPQGGFNRFRIEGRGLKARMNS